MVLYLGLPGWAGTRRDHQLTPVRKKKEDLHRQQGPLHGSSSPLRCFEPVRVVRPIQYAGSSSHSTYCYAELAVSSASSGRNHRHYLSCLLLKDVHFLHQCSPSSALYGAENDNRGRRTNNPPECHPVETISTPTFIIPHFYAECPFCRTSSSHRVMLACIPGSLVVCA